MILLLKMKPLFIALPVAAQALLVFRLSGNGLAGRYPALTTWMALSALSMLPLLVLDPQLPAYRNVWIGQQVLATMGLFAALVELTHRILEHYPGLRRITASGLFGILLATSVVAVAGEPLTKPVRLTMIMLGAWNGATSLYVVALVGLATYLDPKRRRNVIFYERLLLANCLLGSAFLLFAAHYQKHQEISTWAGTICGVLLPILWMRMSPAGEVDHRTGGPRDQGGTPLVETEAAVDRLEKMVTRSGG